MSERMNELQAEADSLGVKYSKSMKEEALAKRIDEFKASQLQGETNPMVVPIGGDIAGPEFKVGSVPSKTYTTDTMTVIRN